ILVVKVFVCTHILTVRTQVFLFKANYGTAVDFGLLFLILIQISKGPVEKNYVAKAERITIDSISYWSFRCHAL
ncbi:hypothetical protein, partial [Acinetobacter lwoffii]|uniref:hypothetical protein n=1 Tax=Acinetobacter lwoffii TaxID=28090 RepID=UPI00209BB36A